MRLRLRSRGRGEVVVNRIDQGAVSSIRTAHGCRPTPRLVLMSITPFFVFAIASRLTEYRLAGECRAGKGTTARLPEKRFGLWPSAPGRRIVLARSRAPALQARRSIHRGPATNRPFLAEMAGRSSPLMRPPSRPGNLKLGYQQGAAKDHMAPRASPGAGTGIPPQGPPALMRIAYSAHCSGRGR